MSEMKNETTATVNEQTTTTTAAPGLEDILKELAAKKGVKIDTAALAASLTVEQVECDDNREFEAKIHEMTVEKAESREVVIRNPIRKNEIELADECAGQFKEFKEAFYAGLVGKPTGLEKVSYRPDGFIRRDGESEGSKILAARQFVVTLKIAGKWETLPRYLATEQGGHFALSASQTLKAARTLSSHLNYVWVKGHSAEELAAALKLGKKAAK